MADTADKNENNVPGSLYNDYSCIDCGLCPEIAPQFFTRDDDEGYSYVYKQPVTPDERKKELAAIESCPTESIGFDG